MNFKRIGKHIWLAAKDVLRPLDGAGGLGGIVLPMTLVARLDAVLQPTGREVLDRDAELDPASPAERDKALRRASGRDYYNRSGLTLPGLNLRAGAARLEADFNAYLDGFSPNIATILDEFEFRGSVGRLAGAGVLGKLIGSFVSGDFNLGPDPVRHPDGRIAQPGLDDAGMRSVFDDLVRRCHEDCGEDAGARCTPRDAIDLMTRLVLLPVGKDIQPGFYSIYDGACGGGGMLLAANEVLRGFAGALNKEVSTHLYGQEIDGKTRAICKTKLLLDGTDGTASTIAGGAGQSTLSEDGLPSYQFDFMLSNPPHGRRWKADLQRLGGRKEMRDPRFAIEHDGDPRFSLVPRASDSQMLFLVNALSKMKRGTPTGSRLAQLHTGASLSTGDAGQGESNIRRWIVENDWLEAVIALPANILHDTGAAAYVWVLANRKPEHRRGKVQLIDAAAWFGDLPRTLGKKSRQLSEAHVARICDTFLEFRESGHSRILDNEAFGYRKVTVERPLRIEGADPDRVHTAEEVRAMKESGKRRETAPPVIVRVHRPGTPANPRHGLFEASVDGGTVVAEYEPDAKLRDTETIPLQEEGGIEAFLDREVLPYTPDAWYRPETAKIGCQIHFNRYFYRPQPARQLEEIRAEILALERETEGLLEQILAGTG